LSLLSGALSFVAVVNGVSAAPNNVGPQAYKGPHTHAGRVVRKGVHHGHPMHLSRGRFSTTAE